MLFLIPDSLSGIITHSNGKYRRIIDSPLVTPTKLTEFLYVLEQLTGETLNPDNWDAFFTEGDKMTAQCCCSQDIKNVYSITHVSGIEVAVGCVCVKKILQDLYNKLTCYVCKNEGCNRLLADRRLMYQNDGYCSEPCATRKDREERKEREKREYDNTKSCADCSARISIIPTWKTVCKSCYRDRMLDDRCIDCNKTIDPKFSRCYHCNVKNKSK